MGVGLVSVVILTIIDVKMDESNKNGENIEEDTNIGFKESVANLNIIYWLLLFSAIFFYGAILSFNYIATSFFIEIFFHKMKKENAETLAGFYMSIPFIIGTVFIPVLGVIVNLIGKRSHFIILGSIIGFSGFVILYASRPIIALIMIGISYTLFATVIWPCVTFVINKKLLAFAFGFFSSIVNLSLFLFQFIVILIFHRTNSYYMVNLT